jgi:hypothetical protein
MIFEEGGHSLAEAVLLSLPSLLSISDAWSLNSTAFVFTSTSFASRCSQKLIYKFSNIYLFSVLFLWSEREILKGLWLLPCEKK